MESESAMKTLTIRQPWIERLISGAKRYEFRNWKTTYRGPILLHAGKRIDDDALPTTAELDAPRGSIVAVGCLVDIVKNDRYNLMGEPRFEYGWSIRDIVRFPEPIAARGQLWLWQCRNDEAIAIAKRLLASAFDA